MPPPDPFHTLLAAQRPLVLGIGGGGDVVGAFALAELLREHSNAEPLLGGIAWERMPLDPHPGPRAANEIEHARELVPGVMMASADTRVAGTDTRFSESRMAELTGSEVVLIDIAGGPRRLATSLAQALDRLDRDVLVLLDVGGDVLARGDEPGLGSPLCDAILLGAGAAIQAEGIPVVGAVFGAACDGELTLQEVSARISELGENGALSGALGLTKSLAPRLERAAAHVRTEASALPIRALRGERGTVEIRGGRRQVQLTAAAALITFFDPLRATQAAAPLANAVADADDLEHANTILNELGIRTELDYERTASNTAAKPWPPPMHIVSKP